MTEGTEREETTIDQAADADPVAEADSAPSDPVVAEEPASEEAAEAEAEPTEEAPAEPAEGEPEGEGEPAEETAEAPEGEAEGETEGDTDDVAAAIAAAGENIEAEPSLDDITPGTVTAEETAAAAEAAPKANSVSIWPFVAYDVLWAAFAGALVWQMHDLPDGTAVWQAVNYPYYVLGGVVLTGAGVLMIFAVWIASWGKPGSTKGGLFISSLVKGSIATLLGVVMWWGALLALDQIRFGALL